MNASAFIGCLWAVNVHAFEKEFLPDYSDFVHIYGGSNIFSQVYVPLEVITCVLFSYSHYVFLYFRFNVVFCC